MSEQELMDFFPPVTASSVTRHETNQMSPLETKADSTMLFILASALLFAVIFIAAAVVLVVNR